MACVRIVLVGLGDIGSRAHLPALLGSDDVELVGLVDRDELRCGAAAAAARAAGAPAGTAYSLDAALESWAFDAVVCATPPSATPAIAAQALRRGLYVLAEKPIATCELALDELLRLEPDQRSRLQIGFTYRHHPAVMQLAQWIVQGALGRPLLVRAHIFDERIDHEDPAHTRRVEAALREGTPLLHDGAHLFDWFTLFFGFDPPAVEDAWTLSTDGQMLAPNLTGGRLRYQDGTLVVLEIGWWLPAFPDSCLEVVGARGRVRFDLRDFSIESVIDGKDARIGFAGDWGQESFRLQLRSFVKLCQGEGKALPGLEEGLASLRLSERLQTAAGYLPAAAAPA